MNWLDATSKYYPQYELDLQFKYVSAVHKGHKLNIIHHSQDIYACKFMWMNEYIVQHC